MKIFQQRKKNKKKKRRRETKNEFSSSINIGIDDEKREISSNQGRLVRVARLGLARLGSFTPRRVYKINELNESKNNHRVFYFFYFVES